MNILNFICWNYLIVLSFQPSQDSEKQNKIIFDFHQHFFELTYQSQSHSGLERGGRGHFCIEGKKDLIQ
jgi:hypothetical protein